MRTNRNSRNALVMKTQRADSCRELAKRPTPSYCPECEAVFLAGRWSWQKAPWNAAKAPCPACIRIANHAPAGYVDLSGAYLAEHRGEIVNLIRNTESFEKGRHPLERIMGISEERGRTRVTTTGTHLARRLGAALYRACSGDLTVRYASGDRVVQVGWQR